MSPEKPDADRFPDKKAASKSPAPRAPGPKGPAGKTPGGKAPPQRAAIASGGRVAAVALPGRVEVRTRAAFPGVPRERMGRAVRWAQVTARDLMRSNVITVAYDTPLSEVERILSDNRISGAPVADEAGRIVGILSVKDLIDRYTEDPDARPRRGRGFFHLSSEELAEEDADAFEVPVESEETAEDVMTSQIYTVRPDAGLPEIAAVMTKHRIHRVLVEQDGRFLGILSTLEILDALSA